MAVLFRNLVRDLTPPVVWRGLADLRRSLAGRGRARLEWEYLPGGWQGAGAHPGVRGWNVEAVRRIYLRKWPRFVAMLEEPGPLGFVHEEALETRTDLLSHNLVMSFAYVVGLAAHGRFGIALLDWGGGIGHYRVLARALFPGIEIDYWCRETPVLADAGSGLHPGAHFSCDDACLEQTYDLVMAGTSLHYVESWQQLFKRLCQATAGYLYIANTPVTTGTSYVFVQRPYAYGYDTEYVGWCLSRDELLSEAAAAGMHLTREFVCGYGPAIARAPGPCEYRGFLFSPRTRGEPGGTP